MSAVKFVRGCCDVADSFRDLRVEGSSLTCQLGGLAVNKEDAKLLFEASNVTANDRVAMSERGCSTPDAAQASTRLECPQCGEGWDTSFRHFCTPMASRMTYSDPVTRSHRCGMPCWLFGSCWRE